jgi:hypothetical protein
VGHDVIEVVLGDESVVVEVGIPEHLVELLLSHILAELFGDLAEVIDGELFLELGSGVPACSCRRSGRSC